MVNVETLKFDTKYAEESLYSKIIKSNTAGYELLCYPFSPKLCFLFKESLDRKSFTSSNLAKLFCVICSKLANIKANLMTL